MNSPLVSGKNEWDWSTRVTERPPLFDSSFRFCFSLVLIYSLFRERRGSEIQLCLRVPRMNLRFFPRTRRHELNNSYQATGIVNGKKELVRLSLVKQYALLTWGEWRSWLIEAERQLAKRRGTPFVGNYWIAYLTVERSGTLNGKLVSSVIQFPSFLFRQRKRLGIGNRIPTMIWRKR